MTKVDEVARAIGGPVWDTCSDRMKEQLRHQARAAIKAMQKPSEAMARELDRVPTILARGAYAVAIDAALAEDK